MKMMFTPQTKLSKLEIFIIMVLFNGGAYDQKMADVRKLVKVLKKNFYDNDDASSRSQSVIIHKSIMRLYVRGLVKISEFNSPALEKAKNNVRKFHRKNPIVQNRLRNIQLTKEGIETANLYEIRI